MSSKRAMRQAQKQAFAKHRSNITNSRFNLKKKNIIKKKNKDKLKIIFELSFLNTPKISKNITEREIKISGDIKFKFSILSTSQICFMHVN